jgi:hypothetical protein
VHRQVVEHDHVARPQGRPKYLVEVHGEDRTRDGPVDAEERAQACGGKRGNVRYVRPVVQRRGLGQSLPTAGTPVAPTISQVGTCLIDKNEARTICYLNSFHKRLPQSDDARCRALSGRHAIFFAPCALPFSLCRLVVEVGASEVPLFESTSCRYWRTVPVSIRTHASLVD